jgi:hypothetical protein
MLGSLYALITIIGLLGVLLMELLASGLDSTTGGDLPGWTAGVEYIFIIVFIVFICTGVSVLHPALAAALALACFFGLMVAFASLAHRFPPERQLRLGERVKIIRRAIWMTYIFHILFLLLLAVIFQSG